MTAQETNPILEYLKKLRVVVDKRFTSLDKRFDAVDKRFDRVETRIEAVRAELVTHMETLHLELAGRVADLEGPKRGNSGGAALTN